MNQPMTNEQFALWIAIQTNRVFSIEQAEPIYKWLEAKSKKPTNEPITPKSINTKRTN